MAGLIGLTSGDIDIQDALRVQRWAYEGAWIPHPVVRLTTTLPIAVHEGTDRVAVRARWGFTVGNGRPVGNARDDRLLESRLWRSMLGKSPCLVAATGVYEQAPVAGAKRSLWFRRPDQRPILMPGLSSAGKEGTTGRSFAIVTTAPNAFFARFHDRQVCVLDAAAADAWMAETDPGKAMDLLRAPAVDEWEAQVVDDRIFQPGRRELHDLIPLGSPIRHGDPDPDAAALGLPRVLHRRLGDFGS